jgi:signal transduction histidine kinase
LYDHPINFYVKKGVNSSPSDTLWRQNGETYFANGETPANTSYAFQSGLRWEGVAGSNNIPVGLQMPYNQNFIHFHYGNLNLTPHDTTRYRYMLNGVDKNWSDITTDTTTVNYMNLQPGNYTFEVISKSPDNKWNRPSAFSFTISPPWWQTWWAYVIYVFAFAGAIWGFVHYRSLQLVKEKRVLENKVRQATEEIVEQKEEIAAQRDSLETQRNNLEKTLVELKATQTQLIQSEKMASLGELTAGIAHEIQNPLNFVNNFSEVSVELLDEMDEELDKGDIQEAKAIGADLKQNLQKIKHHGKRADFIVKGMLEHSRTNTGEKQLTDMNVLCDEFLKLSYHGLRAKDKSFNAEMVTHFDPKLPKVNVSQQDMGRVMLNLFNNAFYAVNQKLKTAAAGYKPEVSVITSTKNGQVVIKVKDNGVGIPDAIKDKIMQPFFTTKPTGEGTGLGLSLTYDMVVKGHGGSISVDTKEGSYTEFTVSLPVL